MRTQAVILAGGKGTRLGDLAKTSPKPMMIVAGQPFLYWQLRYLKDQGVRDVLLLVSHLGHVIRDYFQAHRVEGLNLSFATEPEPLGTGGALRLALPQLAPEFFLINGDSFLPADLRALHQHAAGRDWQACIATLTDCRLVPVPGNIELAGDEIVRFQKNGGREAGFPCVDAGIYLMQKSLVVQGPHGRFDQDAYWPPVIARRQLGAFPVTQRFFDIGTPERLQQFEEHIHDYF